MSLQEFNEDIRFDMHCSISRVRSLLDSKILWSKENELYLNSVLTEVLIELRDLLKKSDKYLGKRINFKDDVIEDKRFNVYDVDDLIKFFRDCVCHSHIPQLKFDNNRFKIHFNRITKKEVFSTWGGVVIENKYDDDIAFNMGSNVIYLKRHIERAFKEVEDIFKPYNY
ncbi:hypothetical protein R3X25_11590 [Lutibacter sp. TH_r2]|uniref:hypothetical protein n=1 Tax=Lutibacter sp. TH_r2 TaxID=3082083 RepID=UPI002955AE25|nr:hypothetical protein [Lutibacter sp. TH_r2]MDV7187925.1 hypothetical protein [Lutibacter sp. TH_r2]